MKSSSSTISIFLRATLFCLILFVVALPSLATGQVEIVIEGVEGDALKNIQAALTLPESIVQDGKVNLPWLKYFKLQAEERIRTALEPYGYYSPEIDMILEIVDQEQYRLSIKVFLGPAIRISQVNVSLKGDGSDEAPLKDLIAQFPLKKGGILLQGEYEKAKGLLKAEALESGYLNAEFSTHEILVNRKEASAQIDLVLETGAQYRFGETLIEGASQYPDAFLKRHLAYKSGEVFSSVKLRQTQLNILNSERFQEVTATPEKEKTINLQVPVVIKTKPAPSKRLRTGIGYGTDTGARFFIKYSDLNSLKRGYELKPELNISERLQGVGVTYRIPSYQHLNSFTEFKANAQREDTDTYETRILSLEASHTKSLGKGLLGTAYLRLHHEDSTVASEKTRSFLVLPGIRLTANRLDNLIRPTSGYLYSAEVRGTHEYLGSDTGLLQVIMQASNMVSLPLRCSLFTRIKGAFTAQDESLSEIPASLRFFAGGDRSVRGYKYQSLGPKDEKGEVIGGKHLIVGSIELERALFTDWGIAAFYDAGNAFNALSDIQLFQGAGIGVRYYTKVGAIRLDIARQIDMDNPKTRIHFSVGIEL
jgi:translocation and assembly module TamA